MCHEIMLISPTSFYLIPERFKTQEMCIDPRQLDDIPDHFKTPEICNKAVREDPFSLFLIGLLNKGK